MLTLNTEHTRKSYRSEVEDSAPAAMWRLGLAKLQAGKSCRLRLGRRKGRVLTHAPG
jgi:hypothetical protein